jgi:hypothetical protein
MLQISKVVPRIAHILECSIILVFPLENREWRVTDFSFLNPLDSMVCIILYPLDVVEKLTVE